MMQPRVTRGSMPFRQLVVVAAFAAALTAGACSKDRTPATPTPAAHASVAVTSVNVAGERAATGYVYRVVVRVKESGGVTATISAVDLTFASGTTTVTTARFDQVIPSSGNACAANAA